MVPQSDEATVPLAECRGVGRATIERLLPIVYDELRAIAAHALSRERDANTLQPTALVHEAYLRLADRSDVRWESRAHFLACAARVIRNILVDSARARRAEKRGGGCTHITLADDLLPVEESEVDLLALDEALERLARLSPRQREAVELRFFGGLSLRETAEVLDVSVATVKNDWAIARAWLRRELGGGAAR